jgi:hypothetical protein
MQLLGMFSKFHSCKKLKNLIFGGGAMPYSAPPDINDTGQEEDRTQRVLMPGGCFISEKNCLNLESKL